MKVIQILGPSYCGSTVLGYALNTLDGFFFGSEVRRQLKSFRDVNGNGFPICDYCGVKCCYWSHDFMKRTESFLNLQDIYNEFSASYPEVEYFVDASKLIESYSGTKPFARIICVKHPLRMLSSHIYNSRKKLNINIDDYSLFKGYVEANAEYMVEYSIKYLKSLLLTYQNFFSLGGDCFYFKTDEAHLDNMKIFDDLLVYLKVDNRILNVKEFSKFPCHSLGGNRAPVHLMKKKNSLKSSMNDRFEYYDRTESYGDWKIDNKYKEILPSDFAQYVQGIPEFKCLLDVLGYEEKLL